MATHVRKVVRTIEHRDDADERDMQVNEHASPSNVAERIVYTIGGILITLLALRVLLSLLGANRENGFADLIYGVTYPFVAPFFGLFGYEIEYGVSRFEMETVVAIIVYALLTVLVARLFRLAGGRKVS
jgi:YggT family protein